MPQRFLRPGITNSERWNSVSWQSQSLYIRIMTLVDDYGRCDGRASVIHGACFSVWNEKNPTSQVTLQQVEQNLQQLAANNLVLMYDAAGKKVLQILQWQERIRAGTISKWPPAQNLQQVDGELLPPTPTPTPTSTTSGDSVKAFQEFWKAYPRKVAKSAAEKSFHRLNCAASMDKILKAIAVHKKSLQWTKDGGQFIPYPTTWLNQGRWEDEPFSGTVKAGTPTLTEVQTYAKEKWGDQPDHANWAASFYRHWNDPKRAWMQQGRVIDWKIKLTEQVAQWRKPSKECEV